MVFLKIPFALLALALPLFYLISSVYASDDIYFGDNFDILDASNWEVSDNKNETLIIKEGDNGILRLSSVKDNDLPFLKLKKDLAGLGDFSVEIKYRMLSWGFGSGFILSDKELPPYSELDMVLDDFIFVTWPNATGGYDAVSRPCPTDTESCIHDNYGLQVNQTHDSSWHVFKFTYINGIYTVSKDGIKIFESENSDLKIGYIYFGSPHRTHTSTVWPVHDLDYIKISTQDTVNQKSKIIIVPGFGASWNIGAIMNGSHEGNWEVPEFVDLYNGLVKSIENNGYTKNQDLFVFGYDWRKNINLLADDLFDFIESKTPESGDKVYLVGHSMGGLVSRAYAQKHGTTKVEKIITIGSPHQGLLETYSLWEGASVWGDVWWEKAALELGVHLNNKPGDTRVDTLRQQAPGIKDLLPVYDFLRQNGVLKPWSQLSQKNEYLNTLNSGFDTIDLVTEAMVGVGGQTKYILNTTLRSGLDRLFDRWEDGKPTVENPFVFTDGDGTVIKASAVGPFSNHIELNKYHNGLAYEKEGLEKIIEELGLDISKVEVHEPDHRDNFLAVILRSPGDLLVCNKSETLCNSDLGIYLPEHKLFLLPQYNGDEMSARVIENGTGSYSLHVGIVDDDEEWEILNGKIEQYDQIDRYTIEQTNDSLGVSLDSNTQRRNATVAGNELNTYSPTWDKSRYFLLANDENTPVNLRLKYIKLLRTSLRLEFKKASKINNFDYLYAVKDVWDACDRLAGRLLSDRSAVSQTSVTLYTNRTTKLSENVMKKVSKSNKPMAAVLFEFASEKMTEVNSLNTNQTDLRADLLMSAEYLFYSALDGI